MKISDHERVRKELKEKRIDISNLRFYATQAREFKWATDIIGPDVIETTLKDIANRLAYEVAMKEVEWST